MRGPAPDGRPPAPVQPDKPFEPLLRSGSYALIEELPPLRAMRWIYGRVAKGAEDVGFG